MVETTVLPLFNKLRLLPAAEGRVKLVCNGAVTTVRFFPEAQIRILSSGMIWMVGMFQVVATPGLGGVLDSL